MNRISVCIATMNGEKYIKDQINSIIPQLSKNDEIIVSDASSNDSTIDILNSFHSDNRIKILKLSKGTGIVKNFENALSHASGEYIFLCDQDDIWLPKKVESSMDILQKYDLVVSDCKIVDEDLKVIYDSYFRINKSHKGVFKNIIKNSYKGCCMAFRRKVLSKSLPFPSNVPMHDIWIGLIAEINYSVIFYDQALILHRRHNTNSSELFSQLSFYNKLKIRYNLVRALFNKVYEKNISFNSRLQK